MPQNAKKHARLLRQKIGSEKGFTNSWVLKGLDACCRRDLTVRIAITWRPNSMKAMVLTVHPKPSRSTSWSNIILYPSCHGSFISAPPNLKKVEIGCVAYGITNPPMAAPEEARPVASPLCFRNHVETALVAP